MERRCPETKGRESQVRSQHNVYIFNGKLVYIFNGKFVYIFNGKFVYIFTFDYTFSGKFVSKFWQNQG